ncbi:DedD protein [Natronospira proteinivora]|uniref:DedD protein n=1 Tax=Natronospira proteinivora TaxID=1807133 RepID=A0ABT1G729_9GAMM|nr:SPOR domain-containing protein [Natronospira proteinivora]MCP1727097.1 DedD protein [Natronospira proteinivora]
MDRKLKERIIGLVVLLTIAVLFLPMMLGGPDDSERSVRLDRPDADQDLPVTRMDLREESTEAEEAPDDDLFRPRPRDEAEPARDETEDEPAQARGMDETGDREDALADETTLDTRVPEEEAPPAEPEREDEREAEPEPETEPESEPEGEPETDTDTEEAPADDVPSGSGWAAQVGSFADRENAEGLVSDLRAEGFQSFLMRYESDDRVLYRVRVGLEPERDDAQALAERILEQTGHEASPVPHP